MADPSPAVRDNEEQHGPFTFQYSSQQRHATVVPFWCTSNTSHSFFELASSILKYALPPA
jgi:hypothetical protein